MNSGGKHCLALSVDGEVYSWGEGDDGKLGHGNKTSADRPRVIEALRGKDISYIACGGAHSAAITATGNLKPVNKVCRFCLTGQVLKIILNIQNFKLLMTRGSHFEGKSHQTFIQL